MASPELAEEAVVKGIGRISSILPVYLRVALHEGEEAPKFFFSRKETVPRLALELSSGLMALHNVTFLVANN